MKKATLWLVLTLCLALIVPGALAEAYVPGETTSALIAGAFDSGMIVGGDLRIQLDLNEDAFASSEEEKAQIRAVEQLFDAATLTAGAGKTADGLRIELAGTYAPEGASMAADVTAAVTLTKDGVSIESNVISGERITARWETVLALCGADQATIQQIMSLKDADFGAMMTEMMAQVQAIVPLVQQLAQPYIDLAVQFGSTLSVQENANVPADGPFPAVENELIVTYTSADVALLITALADQLEQDANLAPMIDALLAENGVTVTVGESTRAMTTADVCENMRQEADDFSDEGDVYTVMLGYCEAGLPFYMLASETEPESGVNTVVMICNAGATENSFDFLLNAAENEADGTTDEEFQLTFAVAEDPADASHVEVNMGLSVSEEGQQIVHMECNAVGSAFTTEENLSGIQADCTMGMTAEGARMVYTYRVEEAPTANGGERTRVTGKMDMYEEPTGNITVSFDGGMDIAPAENGYTGRYWVNESMPDMGINRMGFDVALRAWPYEAATLTETALETATNDGMNALMSRAQTTLTQKAALLYSLLPTEVIQALTAE